MGLNDAEESGWNGRPVLGGSLLPSFGTDMFEPGSGSRG